MNVDDGVATVDLGKPDLESGLISPPPGARSAHAYGATIQPPSALENLCCVIRTRWERLREPWIELCRYTWWSGMTAVGIGLFCGEKLLESRGNGERIDAEKKIIHS